MEEYLKALSIKLSKFSEATRNEILEDYEAHFSEGRAAGKTDEEIIKDLGDIDEMIQEIVDTSEGESIRNLFDITDDNERSCNEIDDDEIIEDDAKVSDTSAEFADIFASSPVNDFDKALCKYDKLVIDGRTGKFSLSHDADIMVATSDDGCLHYEFISENNQKYNRMYQREEGNTLTIGIENLENEERTVSGWIKTRLFGNIGGDIKRDIISVRIPKGMPTVNLINASGKITINMLSCGLLTVSTASGISKCDIVRADSISIHAASGNVSLGMSSSENCEISISSGSIHVNASLFGTLKTHTASGSIHIDELKADTCHVNTASGSVHCNNSIINKFKSGTGSGCIKAAVQGKNMEMTTGSGSQHLTVIGHFESVNAHSGSGSIHITGEDVVLSALNIHPGSGGSSVNLPSGHFTGHITTPGTLSSKVRVHAGSGHISIS